MEDQGRLAVEESIISCLIQSPSRVRDICDEYALTPFQFENDNLSHLFMLLMLGKRIPQKERDHYGYFLPTSANARYYVELFLEYQKKR